MQLEYVVVLNLDVSGTEASRMCAGATSSTLLWRGATRMVQSEPTSYFGLERDASVDCDISVIPQRCGFRPYLLVPVLSTWLVWVLKKNFVVLDVGLRWNLIHHREVVVRRQRQDRDFN